MGEVRGREMEPALRHGAAILVSREHVAPKEVGIFLVAAPGGPMCRRLRNRGGQWWMHADRPGHPPQALDDEGDVVGQVMWSATPHVADVDPFSALCERAVWREHLVGLVEYLEINGPLRDLLKDAIGRTAALEARQR